MGKTRKVFYPKKYYQGLSAKRKTYSTTDSDLVKEAVDSSKSAKDWWSSVHKKLAST